MKANLFYQLEVHEANGRLVRRTRRRRAHSFLGAMAQFMEATIAVRQVPNVRDITNTLRTIDHPGFIQNQFMFIGVTAAGSLARGIVVGTGSTAVVATDFNLETLVAEGSGSGQLNYSAEAVPSNVTSSSTTASLTFTRTASNNSGASITVREIGLRCFFTQGSNTFQIIRDVLPSAEVVGVGQVLSVTYTIRISV